MPVKIKPKAERSIHTFSGSSWRGARIPIVCHGHMTGLNALWRLIGSPGSGRHLLLSVVRVTVLYEVSPFSYQTTECHPASIRKETLRTCLGAVDCGEFRSGGQNCPLREIPS